MIEKLDDPICETVFARRVGWRRSVGFECFVGAD